MCDLRFTEILLTVEWQFLTDVSGQHIGPNFKGKEIQKRENGMIEIN